MSTISSKAEFCSELSNLMSRQNVYNMIQFEWDERKNLLNSIKHEIDFADAILLFSGLHIIWIDSREDYGEDRFIALGEINGKVLVAVFTIRAINVYRIISLRRANRNEQRTYRAIQKRDEEPN